MYEQISVPSELEEVNFAAHLSVKGGTGSPPLF